MPKPKGFTARPTTDFAKENLFNVLDNRYYFEEKNVLDLFSGTGSISFEFASRGCYEVISVEKNFKHHNYISNTAKFFSINEIFAIKSDVVKFVEHCSTQFNFIFADPPFDMADLDKIPDLIFSSNVLKPEGLFILEHPSVHKFNRHPNFKEHREYGSVNFSFFEH